MAQLTYNVWKLYVNITLSTFCFPCASLFRNEDKGDDGDYTEGLKAQFQFR